MDVTTKPKHICMLLSLLFLRPLLRKHDYLIMKHHMWCWITSFSFVIRVRECSRLIRQEAHIGGGVSELFSVAQLQPYLLKSHMMFTPSADVMYKFKEHHIENKQTEKVFSDKDILLCNIPLGKIINNLTITSLKLVAAVHGIYIKSRTPLPDVLKIIQDHKCDHCQNCVTVFKPAISLAQRKKDAHAKAVRRYKNKIYLNKEIQLGTAPVTDIQENDQIFPPSPLDQKVQHEIVKAWCKDMSPKNFEEVGCAVCGELCLKSKSLLLKDATVKLDMLQCFDNHSEGKKE